MACTSVGTQGISILRTQVSGIGGRPFHPAHNRALSRSTRGTHFQVVSKSTKFDEEKPTNYTWCGSLARLGKHGIGLLTVNIVVV